MIFQRRRRATNFPGCTLWLRPNGYVSGAWTTQAGSVSFVDGPVPPSVAAGIPTTNGTTQSIIPASGGAISAFFGASAKTLFLVVNVVSAANNNVAMYTNDGVFSDSLGYFGVYARLGGTIAAYNWDGAAAFNTHTVTFNRKMLVTVVHDGVTLSSSVNGGPWLSVASGATQVTTGIMRFGRSYLNIYSNATYHEIVAYNRVLSGYQIRMFQSTLMAVHKIT